MRTIASGSRRLGFTLVELITVVAIIVIIVAVIFPLYGAFTRGTRVETARNIVNSVLTQARALAVRYQRSVVVIAYWRGYDENRNGRIEPRETDVPPYNERYDDRQAIIVLVQALPDPEATPNSELKAESEGLFLPLQALALRANPPSATSRVREDLFRGGDTTLPTTSITYLPKGIVLAKPAEKISNPDLPDYLDFVVIRFNPDGTLSTEPPIVEGSTPQSNLANWLVGPTPNQDLNWLIREYDNTPNSENSLSDSVNGLESPADFNPEDTSLTSTQRGFFLDLPGGRGDSDPLITESVSYKLPATVLVLYDLQTMRNYTPQTSITPDDTKIDETKLLLTTPEGDQQRAAFGEFVSQQGVVGVINRFTGRVRWAATTSPQ